jgi:hypothetical protein
MIAAAFAAAVAFAAPAVHDAACEFVVFEDREMADADHLLGCYKTMKSSPSGMPVYHSTAPAPTKWYLYFSNFNWAVGRSVNSASESLHGTFLHGPNQAWVETKWIGQPPIPAGSLPRKSLRSHCYSASNAPASCDAVRPTPAPSAEPAAVGPHTVCAGYVITSPVLSSPCFGEYTRLSRNIQDIAAYKCMTCKAKCLLWYSTAVGGNWLVSSRQAAGRFVYDEAEQWSGSGPGTLHFYGMASTPDEVHWKLPHKNAASSTIKAACSHAFPDSSGTSTPVLGRPPILKPPGIKFCHEVTVAHIAETSCVGTFKNHDTAVYTNTGGRCQIAMNSASRHWEIGPRSSKCSLISIHATASGAADGYYSALPDMVGDSRPAFRRSGPNPMNLYFQGNAWVLATKIGEMHTAFRAESTALSPELVQPDAWQLMRWTNPASSTMRLDPLVVKCEQFGFDSVSAVATAQAQAPYDKSVEWQTASKQPTSLQVGVQCGTSPLPTMQPTAAKLLRAADPTTASPTTLPTEQPTLPPTQPGFAAFADLLPCSFIVLTGHGARSSLFGSYKRQSTMANNHPVFKRTHGKPAYLFFGSNNQWGVASRVRNSRASLFATVADKLGTHGGSAGGWFMQTGRAIKKVDVQTSCAMTDVHENALVNAHPRAKWRPPTPAPQEVPEWMDKKTPDPTPHPTKTQPAPTATQLAAARLEQLKAIIAEANHDQPARNNEQQRNSAAHATAVGQQTESQTVDLVLGLVWVLTLCGVLACVKARGNRQQQGAARPEEELQLHNAEKQ